VVEAVTKAFEKDEIPMAKLDAAIARITSAKKAYAELRKPIDVTEVGNYIGLPEHFQLADIITKKELPKNVVEDRNDY
jgi:hypothetical protein